MSLFPVFNLSRGEMHKTLLAAILCLLAAVVLRREQSTPVAGTSIWRGTAIIMLAMSGFILGMITLLKAFCGHGQMCGEEERYDRLEAGQGLQTAASMASHTETIVHERKLSSRGGIQSQKLHQDRESVRSSANRLSVAERGDDDILCGIDLEACRGEFEFNGIKHPAGTLKIVRLHPDGVCERQGACLVGDILGTVDGKNVAGMHPDEVTELLTGKAGTSIVLGLYTDQSREPINRHVVLAPSPSLAGISSRDSLRHSLSTKGGRR